MQTPKKAHLSGSILFTTVLATLAILSQGCEKTTVEPGHLPALNVDSGAPSSSAFHSEFQLPGDYDSVILPHYNAGVAGWFTGVSGVKIVTRRFSVTNPKGIIVLLPGRTEPIIKYAEVIYDLNQQGYSVYAMSHRGQGESGRMLSNPQIGYVKYFDDYVSDFYTFVDTKVNSQPEAQEKAKFILAHSMGGAVAVHYVKTNPAVFKGVALSAPMLELDFSPFGQMVAQTIQQGCNNISPGESYVPPTQHDYDPAVGMDEDDLTHSQARFDMKRKQWSQDSSLILGGVSCKWLHESYLMTKKVGGSSWAKSITTRILLMQAGLKPGTDDVVMAAGQNKFCDKAPGCQLVRFEGARHEILQESDTVRNEALAKTIRFFNQL